MLYWQLTSVQTLTIDSTSVSFAAPTADVARRNLSRYETEADKIETVFDELESDDVFYDIGANTGLYSLFAAVHNPNSTVVAFEPYPPNTELLEQNVALNSVDNVSIHEVALSDSTGRVRFEQPVEADAGYGSATIAADRHDGNVEVPTERGDHLIAEGEVPQPTIVKIDVEGSESLVLQGLENALSSPECRRIYLEVHLPGQPDRPSVEDFGGSVEQLLSRLRTYGFDAEVIDEREHELFVRGTKNA